MMHLVTIFFLAPFLMMSATISKADPTSSNSETTKFTTYGVTQDYNTPSVGEIVSAYVGDRMILLRTGTLRDCLKQTPFLEKGVFKIKGHICLPISQQRMDENISHGYGTMGMLVYKKLKKNRVRYEPLEANGFWANKPPVRRTVEIRYLPKKKIYRYTINGYTVKDYTEQEYANAFRRQDMVQIIEGNFQTAIEYMGKSGDNLKFVYTEFVDEMSRPNFTREFNVDLNEGNVGAFKGIVFEILRATNAEIEYKVLRYRPNVIVD